MFERIERCLSVGGQTTGRRASEEDGYRFPVVVVVMKFILVAAWKYKKKQLSVLFFASVGGQGGRFDFSACASVSRSRHTPYTARVAKQSKVSRGHLRLLEEYTSINPRTHRHHYTSSTPHLDTNSPTQRSDIKSSLVTQSLLGGPIRNLNTASS